MHQLITQAMKFSLPFEKFPFFYLIAQPLIFGQFPLIMHYSILILIYILKLNELFLAAKKIFLNLIFTHFIGLYLKLFHFFIFFILSS